MQWRKIILFGDSLTQYSFDKCGFGAAIANNFQRKYDVFNRGFSGYNTTNALDYFHKIFSTDFLKDTDCVVIFFGANDSSILVQHVPLNNYLQNMKKIVEQFVSAGIRANKILLVGPPKVDAVAFLDYCKATYGPDEKPSRQDEITEKYATVCDQVGIDLGCATFNLWKEMNKDENWKDMLSDGLHLSELGNQFVAKHLVPLINKIVGESNDNLPEWRSFYEKKQLT